MSLEKSPQTYTQRKEEFPKETIFAERQSPDDHLTFNLGDKVAAIIPKKEFYTIEDVASVIGGSKESVRSLIYRFRKNNLSIRSERIPIGNGRTRIIVFGEKDFIKIVYGLLSPENGGKESSLDLPDRTKLGGLSKEEKTLLELVIDRTSQGKATSMEELKDALGENLRTTGHKVRAIIDTIRAELEETNYDFIRKQADKISGTKSGYVFIERIPEGEQKETEAPSKPKSRKELTPRQQIVLKATLEILSKMADNKSQEVTNLRIILGRYLPYKTTIPEIFEHLTASELITDSELNTYFINSLAYIINNLWDKDPKTIKDILDEEGQIIQRLRQLRLQKNNYTIPKLIQEVSSLLGIKSTSAQAL